MNPIGFGTGPKTKSISGFFEQGHWSAFTSSAEAFHLLKSCANWFIQEIKKIIIKKQGGHLIITSHI